MPKKLATTIVSFFKTLFVTFDNLCLMTKASALTYTTLLSLVPLMAVSLAMLSAFPVFDVIQNKIQNFIFDNFVPASGEVVQTYLKKFADQAASLSVFSILFLLTTVILLFYSVKTTFNDIWGVSIRHRSIWAIVSYWLIISLIPIIVSFSLLLLSYTVSLPIVAKLAHNAGISLVFIKMAPFLLGAAAFTFLYIVIPSCKVPFRIGLVSGLLAATLFEFAKKGFALYVSFIPTYDLIYGTMAAIPLFLIWLYVCWVLTLFCSLFGRVLFEFSPPRRWSLKK